MRVACRRLRAEDKAAAGERLPNVPRPAPLEPGPLEPGRTCRHVCRHVRSGQKGGGGESGRVVERLTSLHSLHLPPATLPPCSLLLFLPSPTRAFSPPAQEPDRHGSAPAPVTNSGKSVP